METSKIIRAREFASLAHIEQMYGAEMYIFHLAGVAKIVLQYGEEAIVLAYLHDIIEDTKVTVDELVRLFDTRTAEQVLLVTDEAGKNRKERKAKANEKLAAVTEEYEVALIVKAADRLFNIRNSKESGNFGLLKMYQKEHLEFKRAAYRPGLAEEIWKEMEQILLLGE